MNPNSQIRCPLCQKGFSACNLPRIATCSHTYCETCLRTIQECPVDQVSHTPTHDLASFPINTNLTHMMGIASENYKELCLLHDKELDLVCVDDAVSICTNCALFGEHRNHNVKTVRSVMDECTAMAQKSIQILTELEELESTGSIKSLEARIDGAFKEKKEVLVKQIKGRFYKIIDSVRNTEKQCLVQLEELLENERKVLKEGIKKAMEHDRKQGWILEAEKLIQTVDSVKIDDATRYLNANCQESGILRNGESLIAGLNSFERSVSERLSDKLNEIFFEFNSSKLQKQLTSCYNLQKTLLCTIPKTERLDDEFLLESIEENPITPSPVQKQALQDSAHSNNVFLQIPQLPMQKVGINVHSFLERSERKMGMSRVRDPLGVSNFENRKKKKIRIPEKYENVFEDLKNDRTDCIDFTNAELGDAIILQLTEFIRNCCKLRTVKLVRNKLSDECLVPLLEACAESKVLSLNLGQNLFTDKALDSLEKLELRDLKNVTLSQNKLNQRNCKIRIADFKKRGLTISI